MKTKEQRSGKEQRSEEDRRKFNDPNYKEPERRDGLDRRVLTNRRKQTN